MAQGFKITHHEFKTKMQYLIIGIFSANIANALREIINGYFGKGINFIIVNLVCMILVLYFFDF